MASTPRPRRDTSTRRSGTVVNTGQIPAARGKSLELKPTQEAHLVKLWPGGEHSTLELAELFSVSCATVYRAIQRGGAGTPNKAT
jgi:hypothetical protein